MDRNMSIVEPPRDKLMSIALSHMSTFSPPNPPPPSPREPPITHYTTKAVNVIEDYYGSFCDHYGKHHNIKRFTWRNYNNLTVQVINYGARITSMRVPDKNGTVCDIALGFDDITEQIFYKNQPLGAVLGRCSHIISDSIIQIDRDVFELSPNLPPHHFNGGFKSFDQVVWTPYVNKSKVVMTYISQDGDEGYPGDLLIIITFELCNRNEFHIDYEAHCTKPTIVNLTHLNYVNLAGSNKGPDEIYNHILTLNSNCYTVQEKSSIPTGEIRNVVNSNMDFQIPRCLGKAMGICPNDGFFQHYCVNMGHTQGDCFVARLLHPPSGRMLEIYSTQRGVNLSSANEFGIGEIMPIDDLLKTKYNCSETSLIVGNVYKNVTEQLVIDETNEYRQLRALIDLVKGVKIGDTGKMEEIEITTLQEKYLKQILAYCESNNTESKKCVDIAKAINLILEAAKRIPSATDVEITLSDDFIRSRLHLQIGSMLDDVKCAPEHKDGKIHGKHGCVYRRHGAVAITPQSYPNSINTKNFPETVLRPGEVYRHSTTYKFWIRAGNPNKWIKRGMFEKTQKEKSQFKEADQALAEEILRENGKK